MRRTVLSLTVLVVLGGCGSAPTLSPEEQRRADVTERCAALDERFTGDLALDGESFGVGDLDILNSRAELVRELAEHGRGLGSRRSTGGSTHSTTWSRRSTTSTRT